MAAITANTFTLDAAKVKFQAPVKHTIQNAGRVYHTQTLTYDGKPLMFITPWFNSGGLCYSPFEERKPEMRLHFDKKMQKLVSDLETIAINSFQNRKIWICYWHRDQRS